MKICPVGAQLFRADRCKDGQTDGQTDMTKLIVPFHRFANAPKNQSVNTVYLLLLLLFIIIYYLFKSPAWGSAWGLKIPLTWEGN